MRRLTAICAAAALAALLTAPSFAAEGDDLKRLAEQEQAISAELAALLPAGSAALTTTPVEPMAQVAGYGGKGGHYGRHRGGHHGRHHYYRGGHGHGRHHYYHGGHGHRRHHYYRPYYRSYYRPHYGYGSGFYYGGPNFRIGIGF